MNRFSIISLGCSKNLVDSEKYIKDLQSNGFILVPENASEDIVVINTCSFIKNAVEETEENIIDLISRKEKKDIKYIVVLGCYPARFTTDEIKNRFAAVDLWLSIKEAGNIGKVLKNILLKEKPVVKDVKDSPLVKVTPFYYSYLKISEGCNNRCSYCVIPQIRGDYTSRSLNDIMTEAEMKVADGVKELILVAEDTTVWGQDFYGKPSLSVLLDKLSDLSLDWIRIMYAYPSRVDDALIDIVKSKDNICNYIDMPLQHISDSVLKGMNRYYNKNDILVLLSKLRNNIPDIAFRTSLIAGFPGETGKDFNELINFVRKTQIDQLGCFAYSDEKGADSFCFEGKVSSSTALKRIESVMKIQYARLKKMNKKMSGKTVRILYEGAGVARTQYQAPEIDNCVIIENPENLMAGEFYQAEIVGLDGYDLVAVV
ncbi:MAG: 30S ribosomal protein S12 methylthiotransferase RimO [bacterium]|nr:30S ribosomal protein S12 methylthiotransferase RimO [bacterium]